MDKPSHPPDSGHDTPAASVRAVDARVLLPESSTSVTVIGADAAWRAGARLAGHGLPDLHYLAADAEPAFAQGTALRLVPARGAPGPETGVAKYRTVGRNGVPLLFLPADDATATDYAVGYWLTGPIRGSSASVAVLRRVPGSSRLATRLLPPVEVGGPDATVPAAVTAARSLGVPAGVRPVFAFPGTADDDQIEVALLPAGADKPLWSGYLARTPAAADAQAGEAEGLALAAATTVGVRRHAPTVLGQGTAGGLPFLLTTAAPGVPLANFLGARISSGRRDDLLVALEAIAAWVVRLGVSTLTTGSEEGPRTLAHQRLSAATVVLAGRDDFTVIGWQHARQLGAPAWDLLSLLLDVLPRLERPNNDRDRLEVTLQLLRGDLVTSAVLFRWLAAYADGCGLSPESVVALTSAWMARPIEADETAADQRRFRSELNRRWSSSVLVGPAWPAWTESTSG